MARRDARSSDEEQDRPQPAPSRNRMGRAVPEEVATMGPRTAGRIKRLAAEKGFGFIRATDGQEYFFHRSETNGEFDALQEGDAVEFQPMRSSKGPRAHTVERTD